MSALTVIRILFLGLIITQTSPATLGNPNPICDQLCINEFCADHKDVKQYCENHCKLLADKNCQSKETSEKETASKESKATESSESFPCNVCTAGAKRIDVNLRKACDRNACKTAATIIP